MKTHFSQLFWGLLVVILDLSLNGFDLLADGVGYLIVGAGCRGLSPLSTRFGVARILCIVSAGLWLLGFGIDDDFSVPFGLVVMVVNCAMIWQLLGGIQEFAMARQRPDLAYRAGNRRVAYVSIMVGMSLFAFAFEGSKNAGPFAVGIIICMLVLVAMILHLILRVRAELVT